MGAYVGLDLGTTYSVVCLYNGTQYDFINDLSGSPLIPSVVCYADTVYIGRDAVEKEDDYPNSTIRSSKRHIGQSTKLHNDFTATDVACDILQYLKEITEFQINDSISGVVITCPAYFSHTQRQETKLAADRAGWNVLRIISEPTAGALVYNETSKIHECVLVYDLGGSTYDDTLLQLSNDEVYEILSTSGDTKLGGDDFDDLISRKFKSSLPINLKPFKDFEVRLKKFSEEIKIQLGYKESVKKILKYCGTVESKIYHHEFIISAEEYRKLINPLLLKTKSCVLNALNDANKKISQISKIILVGGSTKSRFVKDFVKNEFNTQVFDKIHPDLTVAAGAAKLAYSLSQKNSDGVLLLDVTPLSLGIEIKGGLMNKIIPRNTHIPVTSEQQFITSEDNQQSVTIKIFQGERPISTNNELLGEFELSNFPPRPRGETKIIVRFSIDADGLITVSAFDKETALQANITLKPLSVEQSYFNDLNTAQDDEEVLARIELERLREDARTLMFRPEGIDPDDLTIYESVKDNLNGLKVFINSLTQIV